MQKLIFIHPDDKLQSIYKKSMSDYFQVDSAFDGLEGLRLIQSHKPSVIVSDYNLPIISGASLLRFVRNHHELFATPFIFLSGFHPAADTLGLGANEWVVVAQSSPEHLLDRCFKHLKLKNINYVR
jgi:CheY-like chemotaxis protein